MSNRSYTLLVIQLMTSRASSSLVMGWLTWLRVASSRTLAFLAGVEPGILQGDGDLAADRRGPLLVLFAESTGPVEHLHDTDGAAAHDQRGAEQVLRMKACLLVDLTKEPIVPSRIVDDQGLAVAGHPAGDSLARGDMGADQLAAHFPGSDHEGQPVVRHIGQNDRGGLVSVEQESDQFNRIPQNFIQIQAGHGLVELIEQADAFQTFPGGFQRLGADEIGGEEINESQELIGVHRLAHRRPIDKLLRVP